MTRTRKTHSDRRATVNLVSAEVSLDGLLLNDRMFRSPVPPSEFAAVLGTPARIADPSPPAPYGHRNNQLYLFDEIGLYLIEHSTRLVDGVVFVLWLEESVFEIAREYTGDPSLGGRRFFPGAMESDYAGGTILFEGPVLGQWRAKGDGVWIGLEAKGIRQPNGRRGKRRRFASMSVCFTPAT